jgi:DNA-directed RNA polymerase sigma subunit (sigma70/sigma32)
MEMLADGDTFQRIGSFQGVTRQRVQQVYCNAMKKIATRFIDILRVYKNNNTQTVETTYRKE